MGARLYVGNLPFDTDEQALRELFESSGWTVVDVKLVTDRATGQPRGFGFVEVATDAEAQAAIRALNGSEFGGRALRVDRATEGPGGGGRRGGGPRAGGGRGGWRG